MKSKTKKSDNKFPSQKKSFSNATKRRNVVLGVIVGGLLLAIGFGSVAYLASTNSDPRSQASMLMYSVPCTNGNMRCTDNKLERCNTPNWVLERDCTANFATCYIEEDGSGNCGKGDGDYRIGKWRCKDSKTVERYELVGTVLKWVIKEECSTTTSCEVTIDGVAVCLKG